VAGGKLYVKGGRSADDAGREINVHTMEVYDPKTNEWEVILRVDRGTLPVLMQGKDSKRAMDASIVDALIYDFEHEDMFAPSSQIQGLPGDAQRCMHLAGML
jgi:hypothetical protein